jgi:hypothetical protein
MERNEHLNVAILHCHFQRGGVTQVVENHVAAISDRISGQIVLVSGGRDDGLSEATRRRVKSIAIEDFDYDSIGPANESFQSSFPNTSKSLAERSLAGRGDAIAERISRALQTRGLTADNTVLHWHNHSLGKNVAAPNVIRVLSDRDRFNVLLQIHDFAEDYRPENYARLATAMAAKHPGEVTRYSYPTSERIHYATLTTADAALLEALHLPADRLHVIPNSVTLGDAASPDRDVALAKLRAAASLPRDASWCVYPVRGIRRKNVGECLLLSHLMPADLYLGVTLPPVTPIEAKSYQRWRVLGGEYAPRVIFDAGTFPTVSFRENLAASRFIVSTSVAEGFGMAFLEPWLAHRPVIARRLHNVVDDFVQSGVQLDRFYDAIWIPESPAWIGEACSESAAAFESAWQTLLQAFRPTGPVQTVHQTDKIDFAALTPSRQIEVITRVARDDGFAKEVHQANEDLVRWFREPAASESVEHNAEQIRSSYSLAATATQLTEIYTSLRSDPGGAVKAPVPLEAESLVDMICRSRPFFPCRTETEIANEPAVE